MGYQQQWLTKKLKSNLNDRRGDWKRKQSYKTNSLSILYDRRFMILSNEDRGLGDCPFFIRLQVQDHSRMSCKCKIEIIHKIKVGSVLCRLLLRLNSNSNALRIEVGVTITTEIFTALQTVASRQCVGHLDPHFHSSRSIRVL